MGQRKERGGLMRFVDQQGVAVCKNFDPLRLEVGHKVLVPKHAWGQPGHWVVVEINGNVAKVEREEKEPVESMGLGGGAL
jgi:hypothetical protein